MAYELPIAVLDTNWFLLHTQPIRHAALGHFQGGVLAPDVKPPSVEFTLAQLELVLKGRLGAAERTINEICTDTHDNLSGVIHELYCGCECGGYGCGNCCDYL